MRKINLLFLILALALASFGQESAIIKNELSQAEVDKIIKSFSENEAKFREALKGYVFNRKAIIQTIGLGGQITGEYRRESFMALTPDDKRFEKINFFPMPTLTTISMTPEDLEDLGGVNAFALEPALISQYSFNYLGKEKIDELDLFVFEVAPKVLPDPKKTPLRMFQGRIWVDDRDLLIVRAKGKGVPETKKNKFPVVDSWRENVDGKYWFPSLAKSDDEIVFDNGSSVKIRMRVKFSNYAQGRSTVRVLDDDEDTAPPSTGKPAPSPTPKKP